MQYLVWLLGLSLAFALLERLRPARPGQGPLRPQLGVDLGYLLLHGYLWGLLTGGLSGWLALRTKGLLGGASLLPAEPLLAGLHPALQFVALLLASDLLQYFVHRLLHGVPFLWRFHQVHHSLHVMDWAGSFRFHWAEVVVYRTALYVPLLWLGADPGIFLAVAILGTAWGHFNHANLDLRLGPLGYVFNSPAMHLWHHDDSGEGGQAKNFGIVLSLWDWLFGTAYWPRERGPQRLGYPGDEAMPESLPRQLLYPLTARPATVEPDPQRTP